MKTTLKKNNFMKECKTCKVVQPLSNYHRDRGTKGGHKYSCKKCTHNKYYKYKKLSNQDIVAFDYYQ
jgi:hypothetical protein